MPITLIIIFWLSLSAILFSYIIFPFILKIIGLNKKDNELNYSRKDNLPFVSILISAYNEEKIIEKKIDSIFKSNYPDDKLEVLTGSDCSTDETNNILRNLANKYKSLQCFYYNERQGKGNIINDLYEKAQGNILIITDANVIFTKDTIFELIKHYKNPGIGLVDSQIINTGLTKSGISIQEKTYLSREIKIKNLESKIWGSMMGPFGGCYSVRKSLYQKIPPNYLVDDFFVNMIVLSKGFLAINNLNAIVHEDVSNDLSIEFRRKIRISTGNFQNMFRFMHLLWPPHKGLAFCFFSHKILRWIGPFFILGVLITSILLSQEIFYKYFLYFELFIMFLYIYDFFMRKLGIHILILRFITHFLSMNFALLIGFIRFMKGVKTNVWQPTKRNQF